MMLTSSRCPWWALPLFLQLCHCSTPTPPKHKPLFSFNNTWEILGPFQIGTRGTKKLVAAASSLLTLRKRPHGAQILLNLKVGLEVYNTIHRQPSEALWLKMALRTGTSQGRIVSVVQHRPMPL